MIYQGSVRAGKPVHNPVVTQLIPTVNYVSALKINVFPATPKLICKMISASLNAVQGTLEIPSADNVENADRNANNATVIRHVRNAYHNFIYRTLYASGLVSLDFLKMYKVVDA